MKLKNWKKKLNKKTYIEQINVNMIFNNMEQKHHFGNSIYTGKINIDEAEIDRSNVLRKYDRI